ncbi:hypothetical protein MOBT1_000526 [Malassezia obtusa]|uniref:Nuclear pore complex protein Nup160 n=1 Tax=Malassezia obtusa TaxID=76774 RepID=A0AAF0DX67_9BASI|nr:hypothetical protein MOBT1_000526 [Malassezia obtusa]
MLPLGLASASLDLVNVPQAEPSKPAVHAVPSHGIRAAARRLPDTAVAAHALHAATCRIDVLGAEAFVLARVLQSGTELEVRVLGCAEEVPPTSFTFAAPLLPNLGVFQDAHTSQIHLLAVTQAGMLCRLQVPLTTLLRGARLPSGWASEQPIEALTQHDAAEATLVQVVDAGLVLVACADGMVLQLRQSITGEGFVGAWRESSLRPASFFYGVSRLFQRGVSASPSRAAPRTAPTQTLAIASHVRESDAALAFCVCRDRKLRVWNLVSESCVRTLDLPLSFSAAGGSAEIDERDGDAFERTSAPLVQLFYPGDEDAYAAYLLVFVPAPLPHGAFVAAYGIELEESNSWSGGVGEIALVWGKSCDARTQAADVELRDMALTRDGDAWRVWLLWHAGGAPLLQHTLALGAEAGEASTAVARTGPPPGEVWTSIAPYAQYAPLRGPDFDAALAALATTEEIAQFFLAHLLVPGRFSSTTLAAALRAHAQLGDAAFRELARPAHRPRLVEALVAHAAPAPGADAAQSAESARNAWLRLARLVEQVDRSARWPLGLYVHDEDRAPLVAMRHTLGAVLAKDAATWLTDLAQKLAGAALYPERAVSRAQGDAANAEFALVLHALTHRGAEGPFGLVRERGLAVLQTATAAFELVRSAPHDWRPALGRALDDPRALYDAVGVRVAPPVLERLHAHVSTLGAEAFVQDVLALTGVAVQPLSTGPAPGLRALATTLGADGAAEVVGARASLLAALVVLHAALLRQSEHHPPLARSLRAAVRAWQHAEALRTLVRVGGVPEARARDDADALVPLSGLRLDAPRDGARPAMHLLHALAQRGALACGIAGETLVLALGALPDRDACAPPGVLQLARAALHHGFPSAVRAMLAVYAEDAASAYLLALAETQCARCDAALARLARIAAVLDSARDERAALLGVLPAQVADAAPPAQRIVFFTSAAAHWEAAGDVPGALHCHRAACDALRAAPHALGAADAQQLWSHVFRGELALAQYDAAAATLLAIPDEDLREVCLQNLVTALCEAGALATLLRLHLGALQPRVERVLSFKARNAEPLGTPNYFQILYAYHSARGDYKSAAASMYQHARRLRDAALVASATDVHAARAILVREAQSDLAAINALALLPPAHAWFAHALAGEAPPPPAPGRALQGHVTAYLPRERLGAHAQALTIVQLADVRREYNQLLARLELMRLYPELANPSAALRPDDAVNLFLAADDVDAAFATALQVGVDMRNGFDALTHKCVALQRADEARRARLDLGADTPDAALAHLVADDEEAADPNAAFLRQSPRAANWPGPAHERAWRYLQLQLAIADADAPKPAYRTAIADRLVALDAWAMAPAWLRAWFTEHGPDLLLHVFLRHGALRDALTYAADVVERTVSAARTSDAPPRACLPYSLFDALLAADSDSAPAHALRDALERRLHALRRTAAAS